MNNLTLHFIDKIEQEASDHGTESGHKFTLIKMTLTDRAGNEFVVNIFPTDTLAAKLRTDATANAS